MRIFRHCERDEVEAWQFILGRLLALTIFGKFIKFLLKFRLKFLNFLTNFVANLRFRPNFPKNLKIFSNSAQISANFKQKFVIIPKVVFKFGLSV